MFVLCASAGNANSAVTLNWTPPTTNTDGTPLTDLAGYDIYYGTSSGHYTNSVSVGNATSYTFNGLPAGTYYFVATAYNMAGVESAYSNEVSRTVTTQYTLTVTAGGTGSGSVTSSPAGINCSTSCSSVYNSGSIVTLTAVPSGNSVFSGWSGGGCSGSGSCSFTINANTTITATFSSQAQTYTITASAGTGGSITPSGSTTLNSGSSQTYAITPAAGYSIANLTVDGASAGAVSSYTFSNVTANHTIAATFSSQVQTYTITASAGTGGSITPSGSRTLNSGSSQTYAITPAAGYSIANVTVDGASAGAVSSYTFSNVTANHTIAATFTANPTGTGTATINLSPVADTYINVDEYNYSADTITETYTWPASKVANSILMKFDLSGIPAGAVIQSASLNLYMVESDTSATYPNYNMSLNRIINHNPDLSKATGYTYDGVNSWTPNSKCYGNIPMAQSDISSSYDSKAINQATGLKTLNATQLVSDWMSNPSTNYGLLINADPSAPADTYRIFASSRHASAGLRPTLTVTYSTNSVASYTITASAGTGGSITPSGTATLNSGSSKTYTITPASGYSIANVTVDGVSVGALGSYTFSNVTTNHTIAATFSANAATYTIKASAGRGGSISPSGTVTVNGGGSKTYTVTPSRRYYISNVTVDGVSVGAVSSYTFSGVKANHTISATFKR